jgi:tetratricopeptide (TPR) repeat protein
MSAGWAALGLLLATPAHATPTEKLAEAREAFQLGQYEQAIPTLNYLLYPDVRLARESDIIEAHVLLGAAHLEIGNQRVATREFEEALFLDTELILDPLLFSEKTIEFFEDRKAEFIERAERDAEARRLADERDRLREALETMVVIERKPYFINFVPLGAGQFQNGHNTKGVIFFASEVLLGGTSMALWLVQVGKYGFYGVVPDDEANAVRRMQQIQIASGVACLVLMGAGIADALIYYKSVARRPADESLLPDDFKITPPKKQGSTLKILPTPAPSGAGVVMSWEF